MLRSLLTTRYKHFQWIEPPRMLSIKLSTNAILSSNFISLSFIPISLSIPQIDHFPIDTQALNLLIHRSFTWGGVEEESSGNRHGRASRVGMKTSSGLEMFRVLGLGCHFETLTYCSLHSGIRDCILIALRCNSRCYHAKDYSRNCSDMISQIGQLTLRG
jgi:hypothetical protein